MNNSDMKDSQSKAFTKNGKILLAVGLVSAGIGVFRGLKKKKSLKEKAIVILGSGRSGTSVLTRAMNIVGVDLGSNFIKKNQTNPKGFFEDKKIVNTHKKIGRILKWRPFPRGFQHSQKVKPFRDELKDYVSEEFADKEIWGWKDPRNNEFLEMWKEILEELNVEGHYLVIIRNPGDVIASYKRAYNRDQTWARLQWQLRTLLALKGTKNEKRIIVEYDELFSNSLQCMRRIAKTFHLPWPEDESDIKRELDEFIDPNLQRSNSSTKIEEFKNRQDIEPDVKELYLLCLEGARSQAYLDSKSFQSRVEKLYRSYVKKYGKLHVMPPKNHQ